MSPKLRLALSIFKLILPAMALFAIVFVAVSVYLIRDASTPSARSYLVTPGEYALLSERGRQITEETWPNSDGTKSRGWLLRGAAGAPAVVLQHSFGNDRSHLLNIGVRLNEATDFTVLMPDLRAHGPNPEVMHSTLGGCEADDLLSAISFLRALETKGKTPQVGKSIGVYGVGIGSLAALGAASREEGISAVLVDSVPLSSVDILRSVAERRYPVPGLSFHIADFGARIFYYDGCFKRETSCDVAKRFKGVSVGIFAGDDYPALKASTESVAVCFPSQVKPVVKTDLRTSGYAIMKASVKEAEEYSDKVTAFFKESLGTSN